MKPIHAVALSLLSALLLIAAWPNASFTLLITVAWVPLLLLANSNISSRVLLRYVFLTMLVWNIGTTWWLWNSTAEGAVAAILINTILMTIPWWGYSKLKKFLPPTLSLIALTCFWLCFEYIHLNWEISWPWLTLGNALANKIGWIQWYEYTGVGGGSLAIWISNLLAYYLVRAIITKTPTKKILIKNLLPYTLYLFTLFTLSKLITPKPIVASSKNNIVIVQPNIDPYQKFSENSGAEQIKQLVQLSSAAIDSNTRLVIWPETAMSVADWQDNIPQNIYYQPVFEMVQAYPKMQLVSGIETFKNYGASKATSTARKTENGDFYDAFNAAVAIQKASTLSFYNKSKLVPGVEALPSFLLFLAPLLEQFGGSTGGYGRSPEPLVFTDKLYAYTAAPIICYESVYGDYVRKYVQKGATVLTIITNDGWWGNTPGHQQHLAYARLRAIETRRWVARSANTGISAFINERGEIMNELGWDKAAAMKFVVPVNNEITFYLRFGDYIYQTASAISLLLLLYFLYRRFFKQ